MGRPLWGIKIRHKILILNTHYEVSMHIHLPQFLVINIPPCSCHFTDHSDRHWSLLWIKVETYLWPFLLSKTGNSLLCCVNFSHWFLFSSVWPWSWIRLLLGDKRISSVFLLVFFCYQLIYRKELLNIALSMDWRRYDNFMHLRTIKI